MSFKLPDRKRKNSKENQFIKRVEMEIAKICTKVSSDKTIDENVVKIHQSNGGHLMVAFLSSPPSSWALT